MRYALLCLAIFGCNSSLDALDGNLSVRDADSDADVDADADSDVDTDTDADTDVTPPPPTPPDPNALNCVDPYPTPPPTADPAEECVTEYVTCGDRIYATLEGGTDLYDYGYWFDLMELGPLTNDATATDGEERVYVIENVFPGTYVKVTLESCDDMVGSYIITGDLTDVCSNEGTNASRGHFYSVTGRTLQDRELLNNATSSYDIQIIVDSHPGSVGNYLLTFECGSLSQ